MITHQAPPSIVPMLRLLLRRARASPAAAAPRRCLQLKPGQVGTIVHELLPAGLAPPSAVVPPFDADAARAKLTQLAAAWNTADPARIAALYTPGARAGRRAARAHKRKDPCC